MENIHNRLDATLFINLNRLISGIIVMNASGISGDIKHRLVPIRDENYTPAVKVNIQLLLILTFLRMLVMAFN